TCVDCDGGAGGGAEENEQAQGRGVVGRKIKEGGVVFAADHGEVSVSTKDHTGFSPRMVPRRISRRSLGLKSVRACSVQRLSHIRRSPARQTCSYMNSPPSCCSTTIPSNP